MSKFVMECPSCGRYTEVKTGLFARKKVECACGNTIDVKLDRIVARTCPHCGNVFAYDQKDGRKVKCPVCHQKVIATEDDTKTFEFSCGQCGVRLRTTRGAASYIYYPLNGAGEHRHPRR